MTTDLLHIANGCRQQDHLMQKALYAYCYKDMMKLSYRYSNDMEVAASLYNDAMMKVFNSIAQYTEEGKLMAWIKRIVVNTCIDYVRKKAPMATTTLNEYHHEHASMDCDVLERMTNAEIRKLIAELPANAALVFNLYVYETYNHTEIATLLNIPPGTSRYYLSEARRLLKELVANKISPLNIA